MRRGKDGHTANKSFRTRLANMYTPTFLPSGTLPTERSVKHVVKIFWIISADDSATDLPPLSSSTERMRRVRSGRLLSWSVKRARVTEKDMLACRSMAP